jgi:DNA mismatch endonuclease (patch repair protein)
LVLPKWRKVVLVHGCFWHRHVDCPYFRLPKTRALFWDEKLRKNRRRDLLVIDRLVADDWKVAVVWECAVRLDSDKTGVKLAEWLVGGKGNLEVDGSTGRIRAR